MTTPTVTTTIELWIDALNAVWAFEYGTGKTVRTPSCISKDTFPEALNMADGPIALSWADLVDPKYSSAGPTTLIWHGQTELHLTADVKKSNLAFILPFFGRVLAAAKANMTLGGLVASFQLEEASGIELGILKYGDETPHHGLVIKWTVKQNLSGQI